MWIAWATSSLPVPVSPRSSTVELVGATCSTFDSTSRSARAVADDVAEVELAVDLLVEVAGVRGELLGEPLVLALQIEPLDRVLEDAADLLRVPRLRDVAIDLPEVDRLDEHVDIGERGQDDADRLGLARLDLAEQLDAGHLRHPLIGDDHGDFLLVEDLQRLGATARRQDVERLAEVEPKRVEVVLLVVDDEDRIALHVERHVGFPSRITTVGPRLP